MDGKVRCWLAAAGILSLVAIGSAQVPDGVTTSGARPGTAVTAAQPGSDPDRQLADLDDCDPQYRESDAPQTQMPANTVLEVLTGRRVADPAPVTTLYVNDDSTAEPASLCTAAGDDNNDGLTPATPMRHIQALLNKYPTAGASSTLWVDPGTYNESININGTHSGLALVGAGKEASIIDAEGAQNETTSYSPCLRLSGLTSFSIAGLTLKNGYYPQGAGISCGNSSITVTDNLFVDNHSDGDGGHIKCDSGSSAFIRDNIFQKGEAQNRGGAIASTGPSLTLEDNLFENNSADGVGGVSARCAKIVIRKNVFMGTDSLHSDFEFNSADGVIEDNQFVGSTADEPAVFTIEGKIAFLRNVVINNASGSHQPCSLFNISGQCDFTNNVIAKNTAPHLFSIGAGTMRFTGDTIADNVLSLSQSSSTQFKADLLNVAGGTVALSNCIVWNNPISTSSPQFVLTNGAKLAVGYSDAQGGKANATIDATSTLRWSAGNIDADPLFADAAAGDYHLVAGSPCIDAADGTVASATDLDGDPRRDDPATPNTGKGPVWADIGAYEFQPSATSIISIQAPSEDGITVARGQRIEVLWTSSLSSSAKVRIELVGGSDTWLLKDSATNTGRWQWNVGDWKSKTQAAYPDGDGYKIRISTLDQSASDESDNGFSIAAASGK